jgi:SAM-dependent methyltransferase
MTIPNPSRSESGSSLLSARAVLPIVLRLVPHDSIVDVGCGAGEWLAAARELGCDRVLGIDRRVVAVSQLAKENFIVADLCLPLPDLGRFGLALCLEVGEHLPKNCAPVLVDSLIRLAPVVLFSAAVPLQGGPKHINEQWPAYWNHLFSARGYRCTDAIRRSIWENPLIHPFYRQNIMFFSRRPIAGLEQEFGKDPWPILHPEYARPAVTLRKIPAVLARSITDRAKRFVARVRQ